MPFCSPLSRLERKGFLDSFPIQCPLPCFRTVCSRSVGLSGRRDRPVKDQACVGVEVWESAEPYELPGE